VQALYDICELNEGRPRRLAMEKLTRWGFNPKRRCLLPTVCKHLLVRRPGLEEVFPGVDFRDRLHGLHVFMHRVLHDGLCDMGLSSKVKKLLDQRMMDVGLQRVFRSNSTGRSYRVQRSLFSDANMSGADKTHWVFLLPHVIGYRASCLPHPLREPFLTAIAHAQLMFVAARGLRPYSETELRSIFFAAMERVSQVNQERIYAKRLQKHRRNPRSFPAPKRFKCQTK